jgi:glucose-6-phosphate isomerase
MLNLDLSSCKNIKIPESLKEKGLNSLKKLKKKIKEKKIGFIDLVNEPTEEIIQLSKELKLLSDTLVVVGIGGSSLGGKTIQSSLKNPFDINSKKVIFSENIDPDYFNELINSLDLSKTCFNVISKSGSTAETMAQFIYIYDLLKKELGEKEAISRIIFTTDPKKGVLRKLSNKMGFKCLSVPENVGGRFSVLSSVGLLPSSYLDLSIDNLISGASEVARLGLEENFENMVLNYSILKYFLNKEGKNISVLMPYSTKLSNFSNWYVQLWAESLGKKGLGQTPIPCVGAIDQHSQLQLFMDGPKDKFITLISLKKHNNEIKIPEFDKKLEALDYLSNKTLNKLINSEMESIYTALNEVKTPTVIIELTKLDEYHLGCLFMFFEISVAITGEMMNVDTFNQPGVELGKNYTYKKMGKKGY